MLSFALMASFFGFLIATTLLGTVLIKEGPVSVGDPLRDIRLAARRVDKREFINNLTVDKQRELAKKVHFVSELIGRHSAIKARKELALSIVAESERAQVDPLLVAAVVKSESTFRNDAISHRGARGLMQLLPTTAAYTERKLKERGFARYQTKRSLSHSQYNLSLGIEYLKYLERMFKGNRELALIAYNWGPGNLSSALRTNGRIPQESRTYAQKILRNHSQWSKELLASNQKRGFFDVSGLA